MQNAVQISALPLDLVLWTVVLFSIIVFAIYSAILLWHWKEYSTGKFTTVANMVVYLSVGSGCLAVMALSAFWFGLS
jgi:hypothetical protein